MTIYLINSNRCVRTKDDRFICINSGIDIYPIDIPEPIIVGDTGPIDLSSWDLEKLADQCKASALYIQKKMEDTEIQTGGQVYMQTLYWRCFVDLTSLAKLIREEYED